MRPLSSDPAGKPVRRALFVETDDATRWAVRRAAVDNETTVRRLVGTIVREWLVSRGYLEPTPQASDVTSDESGQ
jgi:hypothetical protein